jgi:hypothetical protein
MYVCKECLLLTKKKHFELVIDVTFFLKYLNCCKKDGEYSAPSFQSYESIKFYDLIKILVLVFPTFKGKFFQKDSNSKTFLSSFFDTENICYSEIPLSGTFKEDS